MSSQVNVLAIDALDELRSALVRFAGEASVSLQAAAQEVQRTLDWLAERQSYWQREVRQRQDLVQQAQGALRHCQSQVSYDRDGRPVRPNCSGYEAQVARARALLAEGEAELSNVLHWSQLVQQTAVEYRRDAQRLVAFLSSDLAKSTAMLANAIADLQRYLATSGPSGAAGAGGAAVTTSQGSEPVTGLGNDRASPSARLTRALGGLSGSSASGPIAEAIRSAGTNVRFGETGSDAIAYFDPVANEIVLHESLQVASTAVLSAHLAHEGTHVQWRGHEYSLDEEYNAFRNQAAVWNELKGAESDSQCDWVSNIIARGETRAKWVIAEMYPGLPEYS